MGFNSTHDYLVSSMKSVLESTTLFPHANPGLMTKFEIQDLKQYSPSGGLMIESFSKKYMRRKSSLQNNNKIC